MFYFFRRADQFVRCELRSADDSYELMIVGPDGRETVERFDTEEELTQRWTELQRAYLRDGWWGPHGRE